MRFNPRAKLDTSQIEDTRGSSGGGIGPMHIGVGGGGTSSGLGSVLGQTLNQGGGATVDNSKLNSECRTGQDAANNTDCQLVAIINSVQDYWTAELPKLGKAYQVVPTDFFSGQVQTACGAADAGAGPFYCPGDAKVYIDLSFLDDIQTQFQAQDTPFVNAYVLAHEYGHHVQDLLGIESKVTTTQGASSDSVRLELQADCFAGSGRGTRASRAPTARNRSSPTSPSRTSTAHSPWRPASAMTGSRRTSATAPSTRTPLRTAPPRNGRSGSPLDTRAANRVPATPSPRRAWADPQAAAVSKEAASSARPSIALLSASTVAASFPVGTGRPKR